MIDANTLIYGLNRIHYCKSAIIRYGCYCMNPELLRDIGLFVEVVNEKSFTRAAKHLEMPASTVSRRIAGLEKQIGTQLLHRTTRRVDLTDAGAAYYARCAHLVKEAQLAHEQLSEIITKPRGTLRLSCTPDFAATFLAEILVEFAEQYPEVNFELDLSNRKVDVATEHFDAAIRIGRLDDSNLISVRIGVLPLVLYAAPAYLKRSPALRSPEELALHSCIRLHANENGSTWIFEQVDKSKSEKAALVKVSGRFVANNMSMLCQLTHLGAGIGIIDKTIAIELVTQGRLVQVLPGWQLQPVEIHLLAPSRLMPARLRVFANFLKDRFQNKFSAN
jgi:DNA-binding transcriptional LysR family regulator